MKRALVVQHLAPEGPAAIADALSAAGHRVDVVRVDRGDPLPGDLADVSTLVVMGGPMSARSDDDFPTRRDEIDLLRTALDRQVPVLGVCLGAQLLAVAAGGEVHAGHGAEIGWARIVSTRDAADDPLFGPLPDEIDVLHWHGETYDLPSGAVHLARSDAYEQQAFRVGPCAWGLQFHLEVDRGGVETFVAEFPDDAAKAPGGADAILASTDASLARLTPHRTGFLERFATIAAGS
ncbi:MAG: type 1 glutamine amidotransferase [Acidimicrobiales bacterium]|nr:type 1 glutamine amidotransferase [Acidimicrobiales bacterium]